MARDRDSKRSDSISAAFIRSGAYDRAQPASKSKAQPTVDPQAAMLQLMAYAALAMGGAR